MWVCLLNGCSFSYAKFQAVHIEYHDNLDASEGYYILRYLDDEPMAYDYYGYKPYESLDEEERAVADSFEGRDSYKETFHNRQFYLQRNSSLMLTASAT